MQNTDTSSECDNKVEQHIKFLLVAFTTHTELFNWMIEHYMLTKNKEKRAIERILMYLQRKNTVALHKLLRRNEDVEYVLYHITDAYETMFLDGIGPNPQWANEEVSL